MRQVCMMILLTQSVAGMGGWAHAAKSKPRPPARRLLDLPVQQLSRAHTTGSQKMATEVVGLLRKNGITHVGDLVRHSRASLGRIRRVGPRTIQYLASLLEAHDLQFGMDVGTWRPPAPTTRRSRRLTAAQERRLATPIKDLAWLADPRDATLVTNALEDEGVRTLGQLIQKTEPDLRALGPKSLDLIRQTLANSGFELGTSVRNQAAVVGRAPAAALLQVPVQHLELPDAVIRALRKGGVLYLGELIQKRERDLVRIKGIGLRAAEKVAASVLRFGLHIGTDLGDWPELKDWQPPSTDTRQ